MFDSGFKPTDIQADQLLNDVERQCDTRFTPDVHVQLWKALRHAWFRGPGHVVSFIDQDDIPPIALPTRDYKPKDTQLELAFLDPERQRQVMRTRKRMPAAHGHGPTVEILQFDVYQRQKDSWYEFKDLQQSFFDWQQYNPQEMLREDPREEVFRIRARKTINMCTEAMKERHQAHAAQLMAIRVLTGMQVIAVLLTALMFLAAYTQYKNSPSQVFLSFFLASKQFVAGIAFIVAFAFSWAISQRRRKDPTILRLDRMMASSQRVMGQITEFRTQTDHLRLEPTTVPLLSQTMKPTQQATTRKAPAPDLKRRKRKKTKDPTMMLWAPELAKSKDAMTTIRETLSDAYRPGVLDPLPDNFVRNGGERMAKFRGRMGNQLAGLNEDQRVVRAHKEPQQLQSLPEGPRFPELPSAPATAPSGHVSLPTLPQLPVLLPRPPDAPLRPPPADAARALGAIFAEGLGADGPATQQVPGRECTPSTPFGAGDEDSLHPWLPGFVPSPRAAGATASGTELSWHGEASGSRRSRTPPTPEGS